MNYNVYKDLIDKGFYPIWYENENLESISGISNRLAYQKDNISDEILNIILNKTNKYKTYFFVTDKCQSDRHVEYYSDTNVLCMYFHDSGEAIEFIGDDKIELVMSLLPSIYTSISM